MDPYKQPLLTPLELSYYKLLEHWPFSSMWIGSMTQCSCRQFRASGGWGWKGQSFCAIKKENKPSCPGDLLSTQGIALPFILLNSASVQLSMYDWLAVSIDPMLHYGCKRNSHNCYPKKEKAPNFNKLHTVLTFKDCLSLGIVCSMKQFFFQPTRLLHSICNPTDRISN